ncbi:nitrite reductase small subunit NirD [Actinopolymorpha sp. B11F2]|uniref:nitrite reductase small subunit NirD n=1 Tax=Actinopolymorpha sp. B11F2 TaxID=3160862 RepID=UPI0032E42CC5
MTAVLGSGTQSLVRQWVPVCRYDDLIPERGVAALVGEVQVAIFRTYEGEVYAVGNADPFSGAYVMSRGIVGSAGTTPTVASPMFKQAFDLRTGQCLAEPGVAIPAYPVSCEGGIISIAVEGPS